MAADMRRATGTAAAISSNDAGMLYERYSGRILAYCLHALRDRGEAEDAVQTTFLQAHRALARGTTPEHEFAWLHTIAKNVCRVQKRTAARRAVVTGVDLDTFPALMATPTRASVCAVSATRSRRMPETQRRALLMREWQGLSSAEVASRMGMSAPATYALLTRARRSLADALTRPRGARPLASTSGRSSFVSRAFSPEARRRLRRRRLSRWQSQQPELRRVKARGPLARRDRRRAKRRGGATATHVSPAVGGTLGAVAASGRRAHRPRGVVPTGVSDDVVVAKGRVRSAGSTDVPIADLPRIGPASPPESVGVPEVPGAVDDGTLDPVVQHLPDPLPELSLPTVEEVGSTPSVEVPPVPDLPPNLPPST